MGAVSHPRVALLVDAVDGYSRDLITGVVDYVHATSPWRFYNHPPRVSDSVHDIAALTQWDGDGAIVQIGSKQGAALAATARVPIVVVSNSAAADGLAQVINDDAAIGRVGAEHLISRGLTNLAFVAPPWHLGGALRQSAFSFAAAQAGLSVHEYPWPQPAEPHGAEARVAHLKAWLAELPKPLGVMAMNDYRAWEVLQACRELQLRVPEDVAVLGVDNDELVCRVSDPPLSSVQIDSRRVGFEAASLLARLMRGEPRPAAPMRVPPVGVVQRRSTDVIAVEDDYLRTALKFIADHAGEPLTSADVVNAVPLARRAIERRFETILGRSIGDELRRVRLNKARQLLLTTALPLEHVASVCGFSNAKQLGNACRKYLRCSPGSIRQTRRTAGH